MQKNENFKQIVISIQRLYFKAKNVKIYEIFKSFSTKYSQFKTLSKEAAVGKRCFASPAAMRSHRVYDAEVCLNDLISHRKLLLSTCKCL